MSLFGLLRRRNSAPVARERLQILLAHERSLTGQSSLIGILREEILAVIARHIPLEQDPMTPRILEEIDLFLKR